LTGHTGEGSEGREYGEYEMQVLYRELFKIKSPVSPDDEGTQASRKFLLLLRSSG
jgi:hypothetical protein